MTNFKKRMNLIKINKNLIKVMKLLKLNQVLNY